jgi:hypothetical protein
MLPKNTNRIIHCANCMEVADYYAVDPRIPLCWRCEHAFEMGQGHSHTPVISIRELEEKYAQPSIIRVSNKTLGEYNDQSL